MRAARKAFDDGPWPRWTPQERSRALNRVAQILRERVDEIARLETMNCGKIIVESRGWRADDEFAEQMKILMPVFESSDAREGAVAFAEKRPPRWTGS